MPLNPGGIESTSLGAARGVHWRLQGGEGGEGAVPRELKEEGRGSFRAAEPWRGTLEGTVDDSKAPPSRRAPALYGS